MVCSDQLFNEFFWLTKYSELTRRCSLANISRFAFEFWWQLVRGGDLYIFNICTYNLVRCCQPLVRALRDLFPHVSTFLCQIRDVVKMPLIVLDFFSLLLVLRIQDVILVSGLCRFRRSLFIFSRNYLKTINSVRRLIVSIGCRPWSRKVLCFRKCTGVCLVDVICNESNIYQWIHWLFSWSVHYWSV